MTWRLLPAALALLTSCDPYPADLREWRVEDHKNAEDTTSQAQQTGQSTGEEKALPPGLEDVTVVTWGRNCTGCHGRTGRGDGPQGRMFKVRDLGDPAWQASVTDEQIAQVIKTGRKAMPAFNLPDETIASLVKLIRLMNRTPKEQAAAAGAAGSAAGSPPGQPERGQPRAGGAAAGAGAKSPQPSAGGAGQP